MSRYDIACGRKLKEEPTEVPVLEKPLMTMASTDLDSV